MTQPDSADPSESARLRQLKSLGAMQKRLDRLTEGSDEELEPASDGAAEEEASDSAEGDGGAVTDASS